MERTEEAIVQNLMDAGCSSETVSAFLEEMKEGKLTESLRLLKKHRRYLLEFMHREEKKIDCLDYLLYELQKSLKTEKG